MYSIIRRWIVHLLHCYLQGMVAAAERKEETCLAISVFANAISEVGVLNERQLKRRRDDDDGDVQQGTNQIRYQP